MRYLMLIWLRRTSHSDTAPGPVSPSHFSLIFAIMAAIPEVRMALCFGKLVVPIDHMTVGRREANAVKHTVLRSPVPGVDNPLDLQVGGFAREDQEQTK